MRKEKRREGERERQRIDKRKEINCASRVELRFV
jgi:hypothetical protein